MTPEDLRDLRYASQASKRATWLIASGPWLSTNVYEAGSSTRAQMAGAGEKGGGSYACPRLPFSHSPPPPPLSYPSSSLSSFRA